jgi:membrane-associated protease RseP (regulator of RpoE activity)
MDYDPRYPDPPERLGGDSPPEQTRNRGLRIFGFPLTIDPFFFVTAWLIGRGREPQWMAVWVVIVLIGILAHELGHAFAARRLGMEPWIRLMAFGGMTGWSQPRPLNARQQILVSAAGPAVGIVIGGSVLVAILAGVFSSASQAVIQLLNDVMWVNLGWGALNLLPILPLDGGHIVSSVAGIAAGRRGRLAARVFSVVLTVTIGLWALTAGQWWIAILGVVLTYANVQGLRRETA